MNDISSILHYLQNTRETSPPINTGLKKSQPVKNIRVCSSLVTYDAEKLKMSIAKFFIIFDLLFKLVEHETFIEYAFDLKARFILPS